MHTIAKGKNGKIADHFLCMHAHLPLPDEVTGSKRMDSLMAASRNFKRPRSPQSSARAGLHGSCMCARAH
eukprot:975132-Pelagomonas_calceolata.AAC.1